MARRGSRAPQLIASPGDLYDDNVVVSQLLESAKPAWHRQDPDESARAYEYFCAYLAMGENRNIIELAAALNVQERTLYQYNIRHQWTARSRAYDASRSELAESADALLQARANQRMYDETTIIRNLFMDSLLAATEGGIMGEVLPYAYEIARSEGLDPTEIRIKVNYDMRMLKQATDILVSLNREMRLLTGQATGKTDLNIGGKVSSFEQQLLNLLNEKSGE
jgi:hypothetical protein